MIKFQIARFFRLGRLRRRHATQLATTLLSAATLIPVAAAELHDASSLRTRYAELTPQLQKNQFKRPLYLNSIEASDSLKGDIYAVLDYPFATVSAAFKGPDNWCDMLILHLNTKYCHAVKENGSDRLLVSVGKKVDEPLDEAYRVKFNFATKAATSDYLDVVLNAPDGPMGTSNYRILLEAVALPDGHSFMHLTYSYSYGMAARIAMKAYLATIGSDKIGFTRTAGADGDYIGGVRGVVERNTMRYYLAIDAYLSAVKVPASEQLARRLETWFDATEHYPKQLHEVEREAYIEMKHNEYQRQQSTR